MTQPRHQAPVIASIQSKHVERVIAWLVRNENVSVAAVERAVTSAARMDLGEAITLTGTDENDEVLRRTFVQAQVSRLERLA